MTYLFVMTYLLVFQKKTFLNLTPDFFIVLKHTLSGHCIGNFHLPQVENTNCKCFFCFFWTNSVVPSVPTTTKVPRYPPLPLSTDRLLVCPVPRCVVSFCQYFVARGASFCGVNIFAKFRLIMCYAAGPG